MLQTKEYAALLSWRGLPIRNSPLSAIRYRLRLTQSTQLLALPGLGALLGMSELFSGGWAVALISIIALAHYVSAAPTTRARSIIVCLFCVGMFTAGSYWIFSGIRGGNHNNVFLSVILCSAFVCICAALHAVLYLLLDTVSARLWRVDPAKISVWFCLPATWLIAETARSHGAWAFPWVLVGTTQIDNPVLQGWFPIVGAHGVTVFAWWAASCVLVCLKSARKRRRAARLKCLVFAVACAASSVLSSITWTQVSGPEIRALLLHTHFVDFEKWDDEARQKAWAQLIGSFGTTDAALVITPETFIGDPAQLNQMERWQQLIALAKEHNRQVLVGIPYATFSQDGKPEKFHNAIMQLAQERGDFYAKQRLVPFGEFLPLKHLFGGIYENVFHYPLQDLSPGSPENAQNLFVSGSEVLATICYDIAFSVDVLQRASSAGWILQVSNDAWFNSRLFEAQSHNVARARALETARPVVRVNNVGVTGIVDHSGVTRLQAARGENSQLLVSISPRAGSTPFMRIGYWNVCFICLTLLIAIYAALRIDQIERFGSKNFFKDRRLIP